MTEHEKVQEWIDSGEVPDADMRRQLLYRIRDTSLEIDVLTDRLKRDVNSARKLDAGCSLIARFAHRSRSTIENWTDPARYADRRRRVRDAYYAPKMKREAF